MNEGGAAARRSSIYATIGELPVYFFVRQNLDNQKIPSPRKDGLRSQIEDGACEEY